MKIFRIRPERDFEVLGGTERSEAATMVLPPGEGTGGPENTHDKSDQWLFVLSGNGVATVSGEEIYLQPGILVLIEAGETHEISNTGEQPLESLNFYAPPAY